MVGRARIGMRAARAGALLLAALWLAAVWPGAPARAFAPETWTLTVVPEARTGPLHPRQMILATIRGEYGDYVALEDLRLPPMTGLTWMQLGRDEWREEMIDGLPRRIFERRVALWPETDGAVTIPPLTHRLTLAPRGSQRYPFEVVSEPLTLSVAPAPEVPEGGRWLPLRALEVEETWSGEAENLRPGEAVIRTVRLRALGVAPEGIGAAPELMTDTVFAFRDPELREMAITPEGPVSTVTWRWTILPNTPRPTAIAPIRIAWFDVEAGAHRLVELPGRALAVSSAMAGIVERVPALERLSAWAPPAALAAGAALGLLAGFGPPRRAGLGRIARAAAARLDRARARLSLRRAARRGDAAAAWRAAQALDLAASSAAGMRAGDAAALATLDRLAWGPPPGRGADPAAEVRAACAALLDRGRRGRPAPAGEGPRG
jgi:hypothetical protein